mmetsp:Transcript_9149/g.9101  ORF Transcript_9149/g.9101 Transcript_9149/m.9101 type:complete len:157 (+) Transcript_9149:229-699(+)
MEKKALLLALMIALEVDSTPGEILRCRQLLSGDVVVIFTSEQAQGRMLDQGKIMIQLEDNKRHIPIEPMNKNGELNFQRYLIQVTLPVEIGIEEVIEYLSTKCKVVEVIADNTLRDGKVYIRCILTQGTGSMVSLTRLMTQWTCQRRFPVRAEKFT